MKKKQRICICGESVILGAVGASLSRTSQFDVTTLPLQSQLEHEFDTATPEVILFDLQAANTEALFSLLETHPTLKLIGISPDVNLVKVWTAKELRDMSTQDLVELMKNKISEVCVKPGGDKGSPG
jgi:hypothetical protein